MKHKRLISTLLAAGLGLLQVGAMADPGKGNNGRCGNGDQGCQREQSRNRNQERGRDYQQHGPQGRWHAEGERGAGPGQSYYRGDRLPYAYRDRRYVVDDWRGHGLRSPPRGYHWVQSGSDYVLVAITTGIILELLLNR